MNKYTVVDFFCGAGGASLGFKQSGFTALGAWDTNKYAIKSYKHNISDVAEVKDIETMDYQDVPDADVWWFSAPCQDISIANPDREGLKGKRSGLFFEVMRLLEEKRHEGEETPKVIIAENVKGLKEDLPTIEQEYNLNGYNMVYRLLNSRGFGVPQNRERYFVVGIRKDLMHNLFAFPEPTRIMEETIKDVLLHESEVEEKFYLSDKAIAYMDRERKGKPRWEYHKNEVDNVAATLTANMYKGVPYGVIQGLPKPRRFTPREVARLQGFPDSYEIVVSNTQAYMMFGNAVTVTVARALATEVRWFLEVIEGRVHHV